MKSVIRVLCLASALALWAASALAQPNGLDQAADELLAAGYPTTSASQRLKDELLFQSAVQTYLWALPALNMYAMKEGSEKVFGKGYNVLPIWKERLNAKTLITTPNSDVIYAMGYLDLKEDGPIVIEAPPGLQGILDDFWQRPICSEGEIEGRVWCGDVGLPGPDHGKGGKYLLLPPDFTGTPPDGYYTLRSRTYGVFVFWRGFFKDPKDLTPPVKVMEQTRLYHSERARLPSRCSFLTHRMCQPTCFFRETERPSTCSRASSTASTWTRPTCGCAASRRTLA